MSTTGERARRARRARAEGTLAAEREPIARLLRDAREVYRDAVGRALSRHGFDDIPRNGGYVLVGLDRSSPVSAFSSQADVVSSLGSSKQTASQLIDTLVLRGYLERRNDPVDRRRMEVRSTERGRRAALAIRAAADEVDAQVARVLTKEELHGLRVGLLAYGTIRERPEETSVVTSSDRRPPRRAARAGGTRDGRENPR